MAKLNVLVISDEISLEKKDLPKNIRLDLCFWKSSNINGNIELDDINLLDPDIIFFDLPKSIYLYQREFENLKNIVRSLEKPSWIEDYELEEKKVLIKENREIINQINKFEKYEILMYGYDKPLEEAVCSLLSEELGLKILKRTVDKVDIEFETENKIFVVEIKGLDGQVTPKKTRQLSNWYLDKLENTSDTEKTIKALLICNPYRNLEPDKRENPFHKHVIKDAEGREWGLLSSLELFEAYKKIIREKLNKEEVIQALENQIGIIKF